MKKIDIEYYYLRSNKTKTKDKKWGYYSREQLHTFNTEHYTKDNGRYNEPCKRLNLMQDR